MAHNCSQPNALTYAVATEIMLSDDIEHNFVDECRRITDWSNWKQAIQVKLDLLAKHKVFRPIAPTSSHVKAVGYKWVFVWKCNENNKIVHYKALLLRKAFHNALGLTMMKLIYPLWM
ncbi:hypothetical protein ACFX1T_040742 [Malus domestica]